MEVFAALLILAGIGRVLAWDELKARWQGDGSWQTLEIDFPSSLTADAVRAWLGTLAGLPPSTAVAVEVVSSHQGVVHRIGGPQATIDTLRGGLRAHVPAARLSVASPADVTYERALSWKLLPPSGALRAIDAQELATSLLAALQPLHERELMSVRWLLGAKRHPLLPLTSREQLQGTDRLRATRAKQTEPLLAAELVVAVRTGHPKRADHLLSRVAVVLRSLAGPSGRLVGRRIGPATTARLLRRRRLGLRPMVLSASELGGLLSWPIGAPALPGVVTGAARLLLPSPRIPTTGRLIATSNWPGLARPLCQDEAGAISHTLVAGPTGTGKSALLTNIVAGDMATGRGLVLIDGKGDLAEDVLARVPEHRRDDVIVLDLGAGDRITGLRLFSRTTEPDLAADLVLGVLADLFKDSWGPRSEQWLRAGLQTIAHDPQATLAELPLLFSDPQFRRQMVGRVHDPLLAATWASFEAMGQAERANQLAAPLNKLSVLLGRRRLRALLGQRNAALDLASVMNGSKLLVVSLAPGAIGSLAARLVGALVMFEVYSATRGRVRLAPSERRPCMVVVDEPQAFGDMPMPLDVLFEQARGLGVGLSLAVQSLARLSPRLRSSVLTNVGTIVAFRQNADDARLLARELDGVSPEDLQALSQFEVAARIGLGNGAVAPPATGLTHPPVAETSDPTLLRQQSADRHGVDLDAIDAHLFSTPRGSVRDTGVGRKRRTS